MIVVELGSEYSPNIRVPTNEHIYVYDIFSCNKKIH